MKAIDAFELQKIESGDNRCPFGALLHQLAIAANPMEVRTFAGQVPPNGVAISAGPTSLRRNREFFIEFQAKDVFMKIDFVEKMPASVDCVIVPVGPDRDLPATFEGENSALVLKAARMARFKGGAGDTYETFVSRGGDSLTRTLVAGIGEGDADKLEQAGAACAAHLMTSGVEHAALLATELTADQATAFAVGFRLRAWRFDQYRTTMKDSAKVSVTALSIVGAGGSGDGWTRAEALIEGVDFTRRLVSGPGNDIYPESFVEQCRELEGLGVELTVLGEEEMTELGMGALLGVSRGSARPARLLAMQWRGKGASEKPLVLVGKGVTFDSGGISLKPAAGMQDMKWDMGGAAAVAGTMKSLALRKSSAHVVGICGLVENMPDGNAQRPGDVVKSMSGQTIEIINTDAEGRLVLCDVLHWAQENYSPEIVVDLATLTGAILVTLANEYAGLFSNDDDLSAKLVDAGEKSGDKLWRLPLGSAYDKMIDSDIADVKNAGPRYAGSITAAQFLQRFIGEGVKWAHLDVAGMVWADKPGRNWGKGATGYGVRLLDRFVTDNFED